MTRLISLLLACAMWAGPATSGVIKSQYRISDRPEDLRISIAPAGTSYFLRYCFQGGERDLRIGDRVRMRVVLLEEGPFSPPCDSLEISGTFGKAGLPFCIEWLALVGSDDINWDQPFECPLEFMGAQFLRCPADSDSSLSFRVHFAEVDTTGRAGLKGRMAELQAAIGKPDSIPTDSLAADRLSRNKDLRPFEHSVLADAFESSGDCERYGVELTALERAGLGLPRYHDKMLQVCRRDAELKKKNDALHAR